MPIEEDKGSVPVTHKTSLLRTVKAVAWSFVGLREDAEYKRDLQTINPIHVIVVGLVGALLLVLGLIALVHWIV